MSPHRFFCSVIGLVVCLGGSSCESPLSVQEQQRVSRVIPWVNGTYALDPRQGLDYVDPMSPYRGGLRPAAGFQWRTPDRDDFSTVPYRGGPYLYFPKYPLLAAPPTYPSAWQGQGQGGMASPRRDNSDTRQTVPRYQQDPWSNSGRNPPASPSQPTDAAPALELESTPPEQKPAASGPPPYRTPPPPPGTSNAPRDKPV